MKSILGTTKNSKIIDSQICQNIVQTKKLMFLCEFPIDQKWTLIYRASQDGLEASSFHDIYDDKPNTLIIIKSTNGNVFGGYTEKSWTHKPGAHKADPNSFIFSLINLENNPLKIKWSKNQGIYCDNNYGPIFGTYDLYIADKSNTNTGSYSNIGQSYIHPDKVYGSEEAKSFLAGSYNFQVSELEVFTKE